MPTITKVSPLALGCCPLTASLVLLLFVLFSSAARADVAPLPPLPQRFAQAETVVEGKVIALEDQDRLATSAPQTATKIAYRIAIVKVTEVLKGAKNSKIVRVGFMVSRSGQPASSRERTLNLTPGASGIFFLKKHHDEAFFVAADWMGFINSNNNNAYAAQRQLAQTLARLEANPAGGLKSAREEDKALAAALLIGRYRTMPPTRPVTTEPIGGEESKLILQALQGLDWSKNYTSGGFEMPLTAPYLFTQLGIGPTDGFRPNEHPQGFAAAAQAWLRANAETYRIRRFVAVTPAKK